MGRASLRKEERKKIASSPEIIPLPRQPSLTRPLLVLLLLALLAILIYSNTFSASFQFDDLHNIVENSRIKHLSNFLDLSGSRYIGFLSFALNYYFGGLNVFGYHLVNLLIHITNGFLVYTLVLLLFKASIYGQAQGPAPTDHGRNELRSYAPFIALATALLFVAHPIQTQAVTYIVQRFASLAALFYLLTVVCYLKWRLSRIVARSKGQVARESSPCYSLPATRYSSLWYAGALLSTILAMKTKENTFTLPLMILMIEAVFFRSQIKKQWGTLFPFLAMLLIIPFSRVDAVGEAEGGFAQETTEISRTSYLFTQFRVIVTYIRLLFLPMNQNLDYDYPVSHSLFDPSVFFSFLFLLSLLSIAFYLLFYSRRSSTNSQLSTFNSQLIAFGLLWFFLTLSVESSIIPIRDVIFEHRLYLPSAGFFLTVVVAAAMGLQNLRTKVHGKGLLSFIYNPIPVTLSLLLILLLFSSATYERNLIWKDEVTLWEDVVGKAPNKARGHNSLGVAYYKDLGRFEAAIREFQTALRLQPNHAEAHNNMGNAYRDQGRWEEAIREYQTALQLQPDNAEAHNNMGNAYRDQGHLEEAIREYQAALQLQVDSAEAHYNLGIAYKDMGRLEEAIREYQTALRLQPDHAHAHNNLGIVYSDQGRPEEAGREFQTALKLQPNFADFHYNLGMVYAGRNQFDAAIREFHVALSLKPDDAEAHYNLGLAYQSKGMLQAARTEFEHALRIKPDFFLARQALEALPR